ncbi:MAG: M3 family metallopeptidase [Rubrivivax sp.]
MSAAVSTSGGANPLLQDWTAPFGLPPFDALDPAHFRPAFEAAMQAHRDELAAIGASAEAPSFDNTVAAFDRSGRLLARIDAVFYNLTASHTTPALQAVQREMAGPLAAHDNAVYMDAALFARLDALHARRAELGLEPEQLRLLERIHLDFVRAGARLQGAAQKRYAEVMEELAALTTRFAQNVLHDEASFRLELKTEADLAGLPDFVRAAARQAAADRGLDGHIVTLSRSLVVPFLTYSERRDLREAAWRAWVSRGEHGGEHDNREVARDILRLRREQASLHGQACYADYALADTMAGRQAAVQQLLGEVWPRALDAVARERTALEEVRPPSAARHDRGVGLALLGREVRQQRYAVDDAEVKPYFALENVVEAAFDCASRLFGLRSYAAPDLPVYHPDVHGLRGARRRRARLIGVFLQDNFARARNAAARG